MYEGGIADALNAPATAIGGGEADSGQANAEATAVTKQTTETLMAGERIIEALDLADNERAAFKEYEEEKSRMSADDAIKLQPPPRNPVLAAYDIEPEAWVLRVVEKVQSTALQDALLVLPFGKVISLMGYLNIWAQRVRFMVGSSFILLPDLFFLSSTGMEYHTHLTYHFLSLKDTSSPDCRQSDHAYRSHTITGASSERA